MTLARRRAPQWFAPLFLAAVLLAALTAPAEAADSTAVAVPRPPLHIRKAAGPIVLDGNLDDAGWQGADAINTWYETNVGDNVEPQVANLAYLTYDETSFYAGFKFGDPTPAGIRAPLGDHDAVGSPTDYAGVIIDSRNDGKSAQMFLANPRGVQYDALTNDATGEDNAPDFFWDAVGRKTDTGWNLEIRVPFSSLRYGNADVPTWGILLYRNYPRDRRYQFFSARLPRDSNCFICNSSKLLGLADLPQGSHINIAPFATGRLAKLPRDRPGMGLGSPLDSTASDTDFGADVKWNPFSGMSIDATINPDFSQIESDAAQIAANERFALFFPEKRPFFLEGVDLLSTPLTAVYTRTVTDPTVGLRATGRTGNLAYTALAARDNGDGIVIIPGPQGSGFALQDFKSDVGVLRLRRDLGQSAVSILATARELDGGGHNRVVGPDFKGARARRTCSRASCCGATAARRIAPTWRPSGTAASSPTAPRWCGGSTARGRRTGSSRCRTSATTSAPTTASSRRWDTRSSTSRAATRSGRRTRSSTACASSARTSSTPSRTATCSAAASRWARA